MFYGSEEDQGDGDIDGGFDGFMGEYHDDDCDDTSSHYSNSYSNDYDQNNSDIRGVTAFLSPAHVRQPANPRTRPATGNLKRKPQ